MIQINQTKTKFYVLADAINKKAAIFITLILIISIVLIGLITHNYIPKTFYELEGNQDCFENKTTKSMCHNLDLSIQNVWISYIGKLDSKNQYLILKVQFQRQNNFVEINDQIKYDLIAKPVDEYGKDIDNENDYIYKKNQNLKLECMLDQNQCNNVVIMLIPIIKYEIYKIQIDIDSLQASKYSLNQVNFRAFTVSKDYTKFMLLLKFSFLILSIIILGFYLKTYCFLTQERKSFEHKYILILCLSLILYNNPLYYIAFQKNKNFIDILTILLSLQFWILLLLFNIIMIKRVQLESFSLTTKYLTKSYIFVAVLCFVILLFLNLIQKIQLQQYPEYGYMQDPSVAYIILLCVCAIIAMILWINFLINLLKIYKNWSQIADRYKVFILFNVGYFVSYIIVIIAIGQSIDNFRGINTSLEMFILNSYVFMLTIFWKNPLKKHIEKYEQFKDVEIQNWQLDNSNIENQQLEITTSINKNFMNTGPIKDINTKEKIPYEDPRQIEKNESQEVKQNELEIKDVNQQNNDNNIQLKKKDQTIQVEDDAKTVSDDDTDFFDQI